MNGIKRPYLIVIIGLLLTNLCFSQINIEQNRIFIWDVTLSMKGYGDTPDIWDEVVDKMVIDIKNIPEDEGKIIILPFQEDVLDAFISPASFEGKNNAVKFITGFNNKDITNTNICKAWEKAFDYIEDDKENLVYIYTDGKQSNLSKPYDMACIEQLALRWCEMAESHQACYGAYISLVESANLEADICNLCPDFFKCVTGVVPVINIKPRNQTVYFNHKEEEEKEEEEKFKKELLFDFDSDAELPEDFTFNVILENNPFGLLIKNANNLKLSKSRSTEIQLAFLSSVDVDSLKNSDTKDFPIELRFDYKSQYDNHFIQFTPTKITLVYKNKTERILKISVKDE